MVLKPLRHVAALGRDAVDRRAVDRDHAVGRLVESGDHARRRERSAAGRIDRRREHALGDLAIDAVRDLGVAVHLDDLLDRHTRHDPSLMSRPQPYPRVG